VRRGTGLARGYRLLRQVHESDPVGAYLTTIMDGNDEAMALLESDRAGLPHYRFVADFTTHAIPVRTSRANSPGGVEIVTAAEAGLGETVRWMNAAGASRQFFPVLRESDFGSPLLRGLTPETLFVSRRGGRIVGTLAGWNQSGFKQFIAAGYAPWLRAARPVINAGLRLCGAPTLPPVGAPLPIVFAAWRLAEADDAAVTASLLSRVLDWARQEGAGFCVVGFVAGDPCAHIVRRAGTIAFRSRIYLADWEEGPGYAVRLDGRPLYLEAAVL
jgi:hypothetical protein